MPQTVKKPPAVRETWVRSLGRGDPLEEGKATTPAFLPGESHGQRSLAGYSPWGRRESDTTEQLKTQHSAHSCVSVSRPILNALGRFKLWPQALQFLVHHVQERIL